MKFTTSIPVPIQEMELGHVLVVRFKRDGRTPSITEIVERIEPTRKGARFIVNRRYVFDGYVGTFDRAMTAEQMRAASARLLAAIMERIAG